MDGTIIYTFSPSAAQVMDELQTAFLSLQRGLTGLKLVLNAKKTKFMILSNARSHSLDNLKMFTFDGTVIERVTSYTYLGIWLDDKLFFLYISPI